MHKWFLAAAAGMVLTIGTGVHAQRPAGAAAAKPQAPRGATIKWIASYDAAMRAMGANKVPVILYFTYDG
jgi:hypothetical protein